MSKSPMKFQVPVITDDEPSPDIPHYFKPGVILQEAQKSTTKPSEDAKSGESSNYCEQSGDSEQFTNIAEKTQSARNVSEEPPLREQEPATRFESEFSNLRSSKFYDKALESSSSVSDKAQLKTSEKSSSFGTVLVNPRQRGNPLLKHIRRVPWEFSEVEPDYVVGKTACALFLSLRYHNLFPNYIHERLKALGKSYSLRVLLVQVDVVEPNPPLKDLSVIAILAECTLMVSWSAEEAGNYLETYKLSENKSADSIKEKQDNDNYSQLIDCLITVRSINRTDAMVLLTTFKTLKGIIKASMDDIAMCPGIGPLKAKRLYDALRKPLKNECKFAK